jgi:hypothetical protein
MGTNIKQGVLDWVAFMEKEEKNVVSQEMPSSISIINIPSAPNWSHRQLEYQYRKGFYHGMAEAVELVSNLYRKGGYVRPQEIANILGDWTDSLRRWKARAVREQPLQRRSHPILKCTPWAEVKKMVHKRDGNRCVECGSRQKLEVHHIEPVAEGGLPAIANLVTLCRACHRGKGRAHS